MRPKRMAHKGFTIFSLNIFYPIWCLPCSRSITCKIHLFWFLSCLLALILIFFLWLKRKIVFVLVFHLFFQLIFSKFITFDFANGVFDFQNEIDMDLTHVTASVVVTSQQHSRPRHSDLYHGRTRQRGCSFWGSCLNNLQNSCIDC